MKTSLRTIFLGAVMELLFLNCLNDVHVSLGGFLLVKEALGHTCAKRFFKISQKSDKLHILGFCKAMSATDLKTLSSK